MPNKKVLTYIFTLALFILSTSLSPAVEDMTLSLKAVVDEALKSNPEILAAKRSYEAARAKIPQELFPEDPMLEYRYY